MEAAHLFVCIGEDPATLQLAASLLAKPTLSTTSNSPTPVLVLPCHILPFHAKDLVMAALGSELPVVRRAILEAVVENEEQSVTAIALDEVVVSRGAMARPLQVFQILQFRNK